MKVSPHFLRLYQKTVRRYKKLSRRIQKQKQSVAQRSPYALSMCMHELQKLRRHLKELNYQLKLAAAAGTIVICSATNSAQAQNSLGPFVQQPRHLNPLREPFNFDGKPSPTFADLDNDGDMDLIVGENAEYYDYSYGRGRLRYLKNQGSYFEEMKGDDNPFSFTQYINDPAPAFADIDRDGLKDLLIGTGDGDLYFYLNVGTAQNPEFEYQDDETGFNPFRDIASQFNGSGSGITPYFIDFSGNGAIDLFIGTTFYDYEISEYQSIFYYENNGANDRDEIAFNEITLEGFRDYMLEAAPAVVDVDGDGRLDLLVGKYYGEVLYFKNNGDNSFTEQTGEDALFNDQWFGYNPVPMHMDLDRDGEFDLLIGYGQDKYETGIYYFKNKGTVSGNGVPEFEELTGFEHPFGGLVTNGGAASPTFTDLDNNSDFEIVVGSRSSIYYYGSDYYNNIQYYKIENGIIKEAPSEENPFFGLLDNHYDEFSPSFVDLDDDGTKELIDSRYSYDADEFVIEYWKLSDGGFELQNRSTGPFADINLDGPSSRVAFVDIDGDEDLDLFATDDTIIRFFKNVGTKTDPSFDEQFGADNPFSDVVIAGTDTYDPTFQDIDHDGDYDLIIGIYENILLPQPDARINTLAAEQTHFILYLNTGTRTNPHFINLEEGLVLQGSKLKDAAPEFIDFDKDGDLDLFVGYSYHDRKVWWPSDDIRNEDGQVSYFRNTNPAPVVTVNTSPLTIEGSTGSFVLDASLTLNDADNDSISYAVVKITNFTSGDGTLTFTMPATDRVIQIFEDENMTVPYNGTADRGVLVFRGKETTSFYQTLLRSIKFNYTTQASSRSRTNPKGRIKTNSVSFRVVDQDNTRPVPVTRAFSLFINEAPVFADQSINVVAGKSVTIELDDLVSDPDNNLVLSTIALTADPSRKGVATIQGDKLVIDYTDIQFAGTETLSLSASDASGLSATGTITVNVTNTAPAVSAATNTIQVGGTSTIDLLPLITDADENLVLSTLKITSGPASGATATIDANHNLVVDYSGLPFTGSETVTIEVCDIAGVCAQNAITITVNNTPPAFSNGSSTVSFGGSANLNLATLFSDADNNLDLSTLKVIQQPASGAVASIDANHNLVINYTGVNFAGTETVTVEVCDLAGSCAQSIVTITVNNSAPVINPQPVSTQQGSSITVNLLAITTDDDDNLDVQTFQIVQQPVSGAAARIENGNLILDYTGVTFTGTDQLRIRVCDAAGACTENTVSISVSVVSEVVVYNAIAPNGSSDKNRYLHIDGLPDNNKVSIFNRWGDKVFETTNYDNASRKFEGRNDSGNDLPSGSYFYKVEYTVQTGPNTSESKTLTGYLSLKQ